MKGKSGWEASWAEWIVIASDPFWEYMIIYGENPNCQVIVKKLLTLPAAFQRMPPGLRSLSVIMGLLTFCFLLAVPSVGVLFVEGNKEDYIDFVQRGGWLIFTAVGTTAAALLYGVITARPLARHVTVGLGWLLVIAGIISNPVDRLYWANVVLNTITLGISPTWYFYFNKTVKEYFSAGDKSSDMAGAVRGNG